MAPTDLPHEGLSQTFHLQKMQCLWSTLKWSAVKQDMPVFCLPAPPSLLGCELSNMHFQYALIGLIQLFAHSRITESVTYYLERKV